MIMDELNSKRKATAVIKNVSPDLSDAIAKLGWDCYEDVEVAIGGSQTYEIDGAGTKWAPLKGTQKYNNDAFIVIRRRREVVSSIPPNETTTE